jgi:outer membrane receptor protein involved in Fe transport
MPNIRKSALAVAIALAPVAPPTLAQVALEEIVVTAQKREQSLQDVPIAVTAVSGAKIGDTGITSLQELTLYTPNIKINSGQASPNLFIRGVGSGTNAGFEQSVGMFIDGIYSGRGQLANVPITMDLQRVEILKGPQGILFGKNTIGGAINITTARPTDEFEGSAEAIYAPEDNEQIYTGVLSGPITEGLSGRLAVRYEGMDGWWDNKTLDEEGPDKDNWYARGSLRWDAAETVEVLAKYEYGDFNVASLPTVVYQSNQPVNFRGEQPFPVVTDDDYEGASDITTENNTRTDVLGLTVNWDLDFAMLTSISAWSAYENDRIDNSDIAAVAALNRRLDEDFEQLSQELRLVSPGGETFDWILGAYYEESELEIDRVNTDLDFALAGPLGVRGALVNTLPPVPGVFDQETESWALFAQGTWNVSDSFRASAGVRYGDETKELDKVTSNPGLKIRAGTALPAANTTVFSNPANQQSIEDLRSHRFTGLERGEDKVTYSGNLQWDATDYIMLYVSASTGFKAGGYDEAYSNAGYTVRLVNPSTGAPLLDANGQPRTVPGADPSILEYEPEEVIAYEIGAKMSLLDGAAELNVAAFRMEYEELQVSSLVGDAFRVTNAGEATSQGVEADVRWLLTERLTTGGALAWLDATYEDFEGATCTVPQIMDPVNNPGCLRSNGSNVAVPPPIQDGGQDLGGETLLFAPEWSANWNVEYIMPVGDDLELRTGVDMNYSGSYYSALDLDPNTKHDSYVMWNARIALASSDDTWSVALLGKNLTDEFTSVWNNDVALTNSNSYFAVPERPRSIAIQARYRF